MKPKKEPNNNACPERKWEMARYRYKIIKPLLGLRRKRVYDIKRRADMAGVHIATIYRWLDMYDGTIESLKTPDKSYIEGHSYLPQEVNEIINEAVREYCAKPQRPTKSSVCREVSQKCLSAGLLLPSPNTVRYRIGKELKNGNSIGSW